MADDGVDHRYGTAIGAHNCDLQYHVRFFGGGLIHLPTEGGWYLASLLVLVLATDLYKYAMHRLSHAVPFLWAMHSFHHSAEAISLLTGARTIGWNRS